MARVYAALIRKGLKTIDDVPAGLRDQVIEILGYPADESGEQQ